MSGVGLSLRRQGLKVLGLLNTGICWTNFPTANLEGMQQICMEARKGCRSRWKTVRRDAVYCRSRRRRCSPIGCDSLFAVQVPVDQEGACFRWRLLRCRIQTSTIEHRNAELSQHRTFSFPHCEFGVACLASLSEPDPAEDHRVRDLCEDSSRMNTELRMK